MEPLEMAVVGKEMVAQDTVKLTLQRPGGALLPGARPGAHVQLDLEGRVRRYSLLRTGQAPTQYQLGVLRTANSRGGSHFIHDQVNVGSRLKLLDVVNDFALDSEAPHALLLGGGIGITPLLSMASLLHAERRNFELHQIVRSAQQQWPLPPGMPAYVHIGRNSVDLRKLFAEQPPGAHAYVCGPTGLIDAARKASSVVGWAADRIHFENFGAAGDVSDSPLRVTLTRSRLTVNVAPGTSLLDALLGAGVWTGYECRRGVCGSCLAEIVRGEPVHRDSLPASKRTGAMCTCVSWAKGPELELNL